ncbi:MAG: hemolysin family protein [Longimicrobiales bacterium]|nr:hemolysin family protein [Longimicrobiales bacterium]
MIPLAIGVVLLLVLLSALLSAVETAVYSVSATRLGTLLDEGFAGAEALARVRTRSPSLQTSTHLLITLLDLAAVGLAVGVGAHANGVRGSIVAFAITAVVFLVLGEILPRGTAARRPVRLALLSAPRLEALERFTSIVLGPLLRLEGVLAGSPPEDPDRLSEREVREIARLGREEGVIGIDEHLLVERAFRLDETTAWDVMTPRVDIFAWSDQLTLDEIIEDLGRVPYSRVPVHGETIDDITGILYVREAYQTWVEGRRSVTLAALSREPFFVPGSLSLARLLRDFQARRIHMGIVADEFGGTDGLVTLEDVLEELVGEIRDETDLDEEPLLRLGRNELVAVGSVDLREINHVFNVALPSVDNRSLNGFILDELGEVPERGETLDHSGVRIEILEASGTQVVRARLRRLEGEEPTGEGDG